MSAAKGRRGAGGQRTSVADARAEAQAAAAIRKVEQRAEIDAHFGDDVPGSGLIRANLGATVAFAAVTVAAVIVDTRSIRVVAAIVDLSLFAVGCALFVVALVRGAQRSREFDMTMAGWWFLSGSAPPRVRRALLGAVVAQTVVGIAGAAFLPFTSLAFGVLVPTLGLAVCGLWSARHGWFPERRVARAASPRPGGGRAR